MKSIRACRSTNRNAQAKKSDPKPDLATALAQPERSALKKGAQMPPTKIMVRNDGPLRVEGQVELVDMDGKPYGLGGREAIALCRCGHSASKPFCDGSHKTAGFQDKQQARDLPPQPPKP
jgi:CDGSH-type Zn-finger protein